MKVGCSRGNLLMLRSPVKVNPPMKRRFQTFCIKRLMAANSRGQIGRMEKHVSASLESSKLSLPCCLSTHFVVLFKYIAA